MTLEDVANQLLLPILSDMDPSDIQLSIKEKAIEVELRKGLSNRNAKLSNWIGAFSGGLLLLFACCLHRILAM